MQYRYLLVIVLFCVSFVNAQDTPKKYHSFDVNYFYGTILEHNPDIQHLITEHQKGVILSYNTKTFGLEDWSRRYNSPDYGYSFIYQDLGNTFLGESYGVYAHFNFYFFNRHLMMRIGQGAAYNTNPYGQESNFRNNAYGSSILSSTYIMGNYKKENIYKGLGLQAGFSIIHYSNANLKAPNNSTNTWVFNVGANYNLDYEELPEYIPQGEKEKYTEPIHYNLAFRTGVNSSDVIGLGQFMHYTISAYADKKINRKSTFQAGAEVFISPMLKSLIKFRSVAYPELGVQGDEDSNRVGVFVGHLLTFNKVSFISQLGYYAYYPYDFEGRVYNRLGLQREFGKHIFAGVSVHSHGAKAEAAEFSIGYRL